MSAIQESAVTPQVFLEGICAALIEVTKQSDITTEQVVAFFTQNMEDNGIIMLTKQSQSQSQVQAHAMGPIQGPGLPDLTLKTKRVASEKQKACQEIFASGAKARGTAWATANKDWWKAVGQKLEKKAGSKNTLSGWHAFQIFNGVIASVSAPDPVTGIIARPKK